MFDGSMTMSFHPLNCPSGLLGNTTKHRIKYKTRSNPVLVDQPSSILLHKDENSKLPESKKISGSGTAPTSGQITSLLLSQANAVGIVGGVSAVSTLKFLEKLVYWSYKYGGESLPFVVCNDTVLHRELSLLETSSFPFLNARNSCSKLDHTPVLESLRRQISFLENSGARCIVMPCHISHAWHGEISEDCSVTFLHVGECVARELKEANLKPIEAGSNLRIGVLATDATLRAGFYQEKLQNQGFEVVLLDKATLEHTVIPAVEALYRKDMEGAINLMRIAVRLLLVRAVNIIILASNDIQGILPRDDPLLKKCIDPMDALARSTIKWAQSTHKRDMKKA